jgi:hypothetical protein
MLHLKGQENYGMAWHGMAWSKNFGSEGAWLVRIGIECTFGKDMRRAKEANQGCSNIVGLIDRVIRGGVTDPHAQRESSRINGAYFAGRPDFASARPWRQPLSN